MEVRDVVSLRVPYLGRVVHRSEVGWDLLGAADEPVPAWASFRAELSAQGCAPSTCRSYAYDLLRWLRFLAAIEVQWQAAERREVRDFVRWLRQADNPARARRAAADGRPAAGTLNPRTGKAYLSSGYAPRTINHALSVLSEFYRHAIDAGFGPSRNPVPERRGAGAARRSVRDQQRGPGFRQREPAAQSRGLSDEVLSELVDSLRHDRDRALVSIALSSGARASELLSMVRGGVDVGLGVVSVVPKGATTRTWIPVAPESLAWLGRYLAGQPPAAADASMWVTLRAPLRPLSYFALRQVLERVNARLGANVSWHDFRHTFTHRLLDDERLSLTDVQALLRHRSLATLSDYSAVRLEELVSRLHEHLARPVPRPTPALGYDSADMRVLFPGLAL